MEGGRERGEGTHDRLAGAPEEDERERQDEADLGGNVFLRVPKPFRSGKRVGSVSHCVGGQGGWGEAYLGAGIEAFGTVAGVEEECLALLDEAQLMSEAFDLDIWFGLFSARCVRFFLRRAGRVGDVPRKA